jgi:hypothetical protein
MDARLKKLYEEVVETLRKDRKSADLPDPQAYVEEEVARWERAKSSDDEIWMSIVLQMLRFGFNRFRYSHDIQPLVREKLGNLVVLAEMEEKDKKALAADENLGLNLQQVRSVAKNARTAVMLQGDFGSLTDLVESFESEEDLAAGMEEMFSYLSHDATHEFAHEMGRRKPGTHPAVRRVISRMGDLVDGSLDLEGVAKAVNGIAKASGRSVEEVDFLLEVFASGDERIGLSSICDVKSACFRCRVSAEVCSERRFEFGSSKEISREEDF